MRSKWKRWVERVLALYFHRITPHGLSVFSDIRTRVPKFHPRIVVDVGANVGQSALRFSGNFRGATLHCFEPFSETFIKLNATVRGIRGVVCHQIALGDKAGQVSLAVQEESVNNSLVNAAATSSLGSETIRVETLDRICDTLDLDRIDYLKVDVEGAERECLAGAAAFLAAHRATFVQLEAGMSPKNTKHVPLHELMEIMQGFGYVLFGIYDQQPEWTGEPRLRFANPVFVYEAAAMNPRGHKGA